MSDTQTPRYLRAGRFYSEREIAEAARRAADRLDQSQTEIAARLGTTQSRVSEALAYGSMSKGGRVVTHGHGVRRELVREGGEGGGLAFAGPFWLAVPADETAAEAGADGTSLASRFTPHEDPFPHGSGTTEAPPASRAA